MSSSENLGVWTQQVNVILMSVCKGLILVYKLHHYRQNGANSKIQSINQLNNNLCGQVCLSVSRESDHDIGDGGETRRGGRGEEERQIREHAQPHQASCGRRSRRTGLLPALKSQVLQI